MFHHHYALVSCIIFDAQRESIWYRILFFQDLRIASICSVFLIILIRYLHFSKCLCVSPVFVGLIVIVTIFLINLLKPKIMCDEYEK